MTVEDALRERIAELEALLETAVYVTHSEAQRLAWRLGLTQTQTAIVIALWRAGPEGMTCPQLDACVPLSSYPHAKRLDPEFRQPNTIRVHIYFLRKRRPGLIDSVTGHHGCVFLTDEGRRVVGEALGA